MNKLAAMLITVLAWGLLALPTVAETSDSDEFTMQVMDAFRITGQGTVITGQVKTGSIMTGDAVCVPMISGETIARPVGGIEQFRKILDRAEAGQMVGLLIGEVAVDDIEKGAVMTANCEVETTDE